MTTMIEYAKKQMKDFMNYDTSSSSSSTESTSTLTTYRNGIYIWNNQLLPYLWGIKIPQHNDIDNDKDINKDNNDNKIPTTVMPQHDKDNKENTDDKIITTSFSSSRVKNRDKTNNRFLLLSNVTKKLEKKNIDPKKEEEVVVKVDGDHEFEGGTSNKKKNIIDNNNNNNNNNDQSSSSGDSVSHQNIVDNILITSNQFYRQLHLDMIWNGIESTWDNLYLNTLSLSSSFSNSFNNNKTDNKNDDSLLEFEKGSLEYIDDMQEISFHQDVVLLSHPANKQKNNTSFHIVNFMNSSVILLATMLQQSLPTNNMIQMIHSIRNYNYSSSSININNMNTKQSQQLQICIISFILLILFWMYRRYRMKYKRELFKRVHADSIKNVKNDRHQHHVATRVRSDSLGSLINKYSSIPNNNNNNHNQNNTVTTANDNIIRGGGRRHNRDRQNSHENNSRDFENKEDYNDFFGNMNVNNTISNEVEKLNKSFGHDNKENCLLPLKNHNNNNNNTKMIRSNSSISLGGNSITNKSIQSTSSDYSLVHNNSQSQHQQQIKYYGPKVNYIKYTTVTPPPGWDIVSKNLFLNTITKWKLQRKITFSLMNPYRLNNNNFNLDTVVTDVSDILIKDNVQDNEDRLHDTTISSCSSLPFITSMIIQENNTTRSLSTQKITKQMKKDIQANTIEIPIYAISVHPKVPAAGGTLELYRKQQLPSILCDNKKTNNNNDDWKMEHTFSSAHAAAQFQIDLLGLQLLWPAIYNMYQTLAIIHKSSIAYDGNEPVMFHTNNNTSSNNTVKIIDGDSGTENTTTATDTTTETKNNEESNNKENVLTDGNNNIITTEESGIAWDDLMRCLGTNFPSMKQRLEALWWIELSGESSSAQQQNQQHVTTTGKDTDNKKVSQNSSSSPQVDLPTATTDGRGRGSSSFLQSSYVHKRILLGPLDFFRLFVPVLPITSIPLVDSSRYRVEQLLRWRKRVARASVLVQAYSRAKIIANYGWKIGIKDMMENEYLTYRLAYDDNIDNKIQDSTLKNEYYEPTVSRDVFCMVRGSGYYSNNKIKQQRKMDDDDVDDDISQGSHDIQKGIWRFGPSTSTFSNRMNSNYDAMSTYQGFTLVGMHIFHWPIDDINFPCHYTKDPVKTIPSLLDIITKNPNVQFFVHSIFLVQRKSIVTKIFVRSLPIGIDLKFDKVVDRFFHGDAELRKRKLEVLFQLGIDSSVMSLTTRLILWFFTLFLRLTLLDRTIISQNAATYDDRTPIPAVNFTLLGENRHFGGSLQEENTSLPTNYVSSTLCMNSLKRNCYPARVILGFIMGGYITDHVFDVSYNLKGEDESELPERILATSRYVRVSFDHKLSMSSVLSTSQSKPIIHHETEAVSDGNRKKDDGIPSLLFRIFITDPLVATAATVVQTIRTNDDNPDKNVTGSISKRTESPLSRALSPKGLFGRKKGKNTAERASFMVTADPFEQAVNELIRILDGIRVPVRKEQVASLDFKKKITPPTLSEQQVLADTAKTEDEVVQMSVLRRVSREDIQRYFIASNCDLKTAAVRIVESTAWRGMFFPIDIRTCRVELQNGQFFQQGNDREGNPIFYFRNVLLGPWRNDENALISSVLHRLETSLRDFEKTKSNVRCTLIVVMGKPYVPKKKEIQKTKVIEEEKMKEKKTMDSSSSVRTGHNTTVTAASTAMSTVESVQGNMTVGTDGAETVVESGDGLEVTFHSASINNPRIPPDEQWYTHASKALILRLIGIVMLHYPERLNKVLVVVGHGNKSFVRSAVGGVLTVGSLVPSTRTREKVKFLRRYRDLHYYVAQNELVTLVGGSQQPRADHFDCS